MFVVLLHYIKPLDAIDRLLVAHREFLARHYANGNFLVSGPMKPRTGGVIFVNAMSKTQVEAILAEDPFYQEKAAEYSVIEFTPAMTAASLAHLKETP